MTSADAKLEAVLTWARRHRLLVAGGILAIGILPLMAAFADHRLGDVELYQRVANGVLAGMVPYREIRLEYPPIPYLFSFYLGFWETRLISDRL
jgi:hypothetical protein